MGNWLFGENSIWAKYLSPIMGGYYKGLETAQKAKEAMYINATMLGVVVLVIMTKWKPR